jgi:hypothetical protein
METKIEGTWNPEAQRWTLKALQPKGRVLLVTGGVGESLTSCAERLEPMLLRRDVLRQVVDAAIARMGAPSPLEAA